MFIKLINIKVNFYIKKFKKHFVIKKIMITFAAAF